MEGHNSIIYFLSTEDILGAVQDIIILILLKVSFLLPLHSVGVLLFMVNLITSMHNAEDKYTFL